MSEVHEEIFEYLVLLEADLKRAKDILKDVAKTPNAKRLENAQVPMQTVLKARSYLKITQ